MSSQEQFYAKLVEKALTLVCEKLVAFIATSGKAPLLSLAYGSASAVDKVPDEATSKSSSTHAGKATVSHLL